MEESVIRVDCDIVDIKTTVRGTEFSVKVGGHSTYAVHFRMAAAGYHDAQPARIVSTSAGRIDDNDPTEVVDLPAGIHTIVVETPVESGPGGRMCIGLAARVYNVLDRLAEEVDDWTSDEP